MAGTSANVFAVTNPLNFSPLQNPSPFNRPMHFATHEQASDRLAAIFRRPVCFLALTGCPQLSLLWRLCNNVKSHNDFRRPGTVSVRSSLRLWYVIHVALLVVCPSCSFFYYLASDDCTGIVALDYFIRTYIVEKAAAPKKDQGLRWHTDKSVCPRSCRRLRWKW